MKLAICLIVLSCLACSPSNGPTAPKIYERLCIEYGLGHYEHRVEHCSIVCEKGEIQLCQGR